ncbi:unnamed protein product [marine sediment metagenome]|uniref:Uncharacterized protein n=1 Tax=marine sediment metagenome TaxID=412755 RepID=X0W6D4_9ZZZZ
MRSIRVLDEIKIKDPATNRRMPKRYVFLMPNLLDKLGAAIIRLAGSTK